MWVLRPMKRGLTSVLFTSYFIDVSAFRLVAKPTRPKPKAHNVKINILHLSYVYVVVWINF